MSHRAPVVEMTGITIEFPGVKALDGVDFRLFPGEVHALMGENGAGKSTLIKTLTGVHQPTAGRITVDGVEVRFAGTDEAQAAGISTVYQEVNLVGNLSVAENVMLGHEPRRGPFVDWRRMRQEARERLAALHVDVDPRAELASLPVAVQQLCAIARATVVDAKVLVLDEPTSSLSRAEVEQLFAVVRELRDKGVAILFVSHFLDQVYEISDRMTVLRNGRLVGEHLTSELPRRELVSLMIGRTEDELGSIEERAHRVAEQAHDGAPRLQAVGLGRQGRIEPFDLELHEGQIVGLVGLLGSGRTESARLLYGADRPDTGETRIDGRYVKVTSPAVALRHGVAFSSEDRKAEGVVGDLTVRENIVLALQAVRGSLRPLPRKEVDAIVDRWMEALDIHPRNPGMLLKNLSGGNQQKVLLARWLATAPRVLILDEPTRGIDVGAKAEVQRLVTELADQGMAVLFVSSELEEVLRVSERVRVLRDRVMVDELVNGPELEARDVVDRIAEGVVA